MTGSVQPKYDKFYAVVNLYVDGKRKPKWISLDLDATERNRKTAEKSLAQILFEYESGLRGPVAEILFSDYIKTWLEHIRPLVEPNTYEGYESVAYKHLIPYFEEKRITLKGLSTSDIQIYVDEKSKNGRLDGKGGLSPRSLWSQRNVIHQTLKFAQRNDLIYKNVCEYVDFPRIERYIPKYYTASQLQKYFDCTRNDELGDFFYITTVYGLRRSEALGLKWDCINWENGTFTIQCVVVETKTRIVKDKTKTDSSYRSFSMTKETMDIFRKRKEREEINRAEYGDAYVENDFIFKWDDGHTYSPNYVNKHLRLLLQKNNLEYITPHGFRHTCTSLLFNAGRTIENVQKYLGHANIQVTANIYGHMDVSHKLEMSNEVETSLRC